ncbi:transposase [Lacrimispora amygdalina]|uniref:Transposase n=1 Tax=Lacrimispora amygdalina TaxID=253257 RepID=A0ABQ5M9E3_9FIRM
MDSIITDNSNAENVISSKIDAFFNKFSIYKLLKKSNFYKESGIPCVVVLKEIFGLIFSGKNLFRTLKMNPNDISFKKNTAYRFLNCSSYNWARLLLLLVTTIIESINSLTSDERVNVFIVDDSLFDRSRSKKVELLSKVFDHTTHRYVKGFKMLTLGWSDGTTFLPVAFSLLSSRQDKRILCPADTKVHKRSAGYNKRSEATINSTETLLKLLDSAKGLPAKYVLFDSWFAFPKTIANVVKRKLDVICMLKVSSKIHYFYQGEWMNLKEIYKRITPTAKGNIIGSATACIRESKNCPDLIEVKIVFVKDRHSKNWLAVLSTDTSESDEEIIRIYGKRWDIEVFFKVVKSYLALAKEFQGRSYDMMIAHTTIVFIRYAMLAVESRNSSDPRTIGDLFYYICDEAEDIKFSTSLILIIEVLKKILNDTPVISEETAYQIMDAFITALPELWKQNLKLSA